MVWKIGYKDREDWYMREDGEDITYNDKRDAESFIGSIQICFVDKLEAKEVK